MNMADPIHVFAYDPAPFRDIATQRVREDAVNGTLFDIEGIGPALMLSGHSRVRGTVYRIRPEALEAIDRATRVRDGIFRRVGVRIGDTPCWTWVAGPKLAQRLATARGRETA